MAAGFLIGRGSVSEDFVIAYCIALLSTTVPGVAFYRVNIAVLDLLHDTNMVRRSVLPIFIVPIKEDNIPGPGLIGIALPKAVFREPSGPDWTTGELGNDPVVNIATFVCTP